MQYTGAAWFIGPFAGSWLVENGMEDVPFLLSMIVASIMLGFFWKLPLGDNKVVVRAY